MTPAIAPASPRCGRDAYLCDFGAAATLRRTAIAAVAIFLWPGPAEAQPDAPAPQPSIAAVRIDSSEAPQIDADLSDPVWARANVLDPMRQVQPAYGEVATERTDVRILFDEDNLYFGIYVYYTEPDLIAVRAMARDGQIGTGDTVRIILDPGMTRRNGYTFQIAPSGGRVDALLQNNTTDFPEWDTIWTLRTMRVPDGWIAEVAIPFRSFSYDRDRTDWGFEFTRQIRHKSETVRWSNISPTVSFTDVSNAGVLTGITGISEGLGLDVQIYGSARLKTDWPSPSRTSLSGAAGGNAYYKITPNLTGMLTLNPDFSDAPLDARQINTTRFSLFIPETRDFFLQDIPLFEFGGQNFVGKNNARPFFSRNIGLSGGVPVSILGGGKLSGEIAGLNIGALSVYTNDSLAAPAQLLTAARISRRVFAESRFGIVVTNGDPTGASENTVLGGDFQYRDSDLRGYVVQADGYYERSFSSTRGNDDSFGLALDFPNEPWGGRAAFKEIGDSFFPALGFANRRGIRQYTAEVVHRRRFRDRYLRDFAYLTEHSFITGLGGHLESRANSAGIEMESAQVDRAAVTLTNFFEAVPEAFDLPGNVSIAAGDYSWTNIIGRIQTSNVRAIQATVEVACCSFYDGDGVETLFALFYRPNEYFEFGPRHEGTFLTQPNGSVNIHILSADAVVNFTPDMQLAMQAQYDNITRRFGFLARYRWEFLPGSELFVALGQSASILQNRFLAQSTQASIRIGHTLRF